MADTAEDLKQFKVDVDAAFRRVSVAVSVIDRKIDALEKRVAKLEPPKP